MTVEKYIRHRSQEVERLLKEEMLKSLELAELKLDTYVGRECKELIDMAMLIDTKMFDIMTVLEKDFRQVFWNQVWSQMGVWFYG